MSAGSPESRPPKQLLDTIGNLTLFHREHEKFYSQAPLREAAELQADSRVLKALAAHWTKAKTEDHPLGSPFAGAPDLNPPGLTAETGVLFMEGEGEPSEIGRIKEHIGSTASEMEASGEWLAAAMEQAWGVAGALAAYPALADLLGERHRVIANDWQSAGMQTLIARLLRRGVELLEPIDFSPAALRSDLAGERRAVGYLHSASELIDRAADLMAESAILVHDNERRWRAFGERVGRLASISGNAD